MLQVRSIAIIGAGPAGAITVDAFAEEKTFDVIRVFERREKSGGCWIYDEEEPMPIQDFDKLANRTADEPVDIPECLPRYVPRSSKHRFTDTPVYAALETNVDASVMAFSGEPIPVIRSVNSIKLHGPDTPFRHHSVISRYVEGLFNRKGYRNLVEYNTTVEKAFKDPISNQWTLTLRQKQTDSDYDYWWTDRFDAVVVATGHFSVPYIPYIKGLKEFAAAYPRSISHTKTYRGPEQYRGKMSTSNVITVGASVSAADTVVSLVNVAKTPIHAVVRGRYNAYFGDEAFNNPNIRRWPPISHISSSDGDRTVFLDNGASIPDVDHIIFGTGYTWTVPFLPDIVTRNNRVPNLYLHVFHQRDPTLVFVGAVGAGLTFRVFEWQAVLAARVLAGKAKLPPVEEQIKWEADRIAKRGDGIEFTSLNPHFEEYFEQVRILAGIPRDGEPGRRLPKFDRQWLDIFDAGHQRRIEMWRRLNKSPCVLKSRREGQVAL